jgi:hypothetical protein
MKCSDQFIKLIAWQELTKRPHGIHTFINKFMQGDNSNNVIIFK